jgi:hypothetical protein
MAVDTSKDPIFQTHQAIWACLVANTTFAALVPEKNRIDYTDSTKRTADKPGLLTDDLPQVRVVQTGLEGQIFRTSNSCSLGVHWAIEIKVGDKRLEKLTELQFAVFCAMSHWETYIRDAVEWEGENVFRRLRPMKVETEYAIKTQKPDPAGWITVWAGIGDLFITTAAIQASPS